MNFQNAAAVALVMMFPLVSGCSLEAAAATCAECGEVRAIVPRYIERDIRLHTLAPRAAPVSADAERVYDVRVRMDRGGSRDFTLESRDHLRVGDRVEVRNGRLVPVSRVAGLGLT